MSDSRPQDPNMPSMPVPAVHKPGAGGNDAERVRRQDDLAGADDYEAGAENLVEAGDEKGSAG